VRLLADGDSAVRRRAALAIGRVGLRDGVGPLIGALKDSDLEVRQTAAFALGLIGDTRASAPLVAALSDPSPSVQGSAAEALGLIGDAAGADALVGLMSRVVASGALSQAPPEDEDTRRDTPTSAFRLALYALVRLKAYQQIASVVLDEGGQPRFAWWPVAYALQRLENPAALPALMTLARDRHPYTRGFAVRGLGALKDPAAVPILLPLAAGADRGPAIQAIRALGRIGERSAVPALLALVQSRQTEPHVRLEAITALGGLSGPGVIDALLDALTDPSPANRAAAIRSAAAVDPEEFVTALSGLDVDRDWSVRAVLADTLGTLRPDAALPRVTAMLDDPDQRVIPSVLGSLVKLKAPNLSTILALKLLADNPVVRAAAATGIGELKPPDGPQALASAYDRGRQDGSYTARTAALAALSKFGAAAATPVLRAALKDQDWAVRRRAAMLLGDLDPGSLDEVVASMRPAPTMIARDTYSADRVIRPPVLLQLYLDTDRGTIQIEMAMLEAPLTVENFVTLARKGYFNGVSIHRVVSDFVVQDGDPRGDGEGGPGYTIRDELNQRPYLRGTVGMALDPWPDTGGSQFFIALSPQPHLDAKYTVFGRVVAGMDVVDQIQQWDVIRAVRVWDGKQITN
jgi:cyclophilin family peptidyl-prolyl cis-trans isomerase/HEAT repeat protein